MNEGKPQAEKKIPHRLSKDGKWRAFPRNPNLLQYTSTGLYYARVQVKGKNIRKSLQTTVWTTAKLRLRDFLNEHEKTNPHVDCVPFTRALELYEHALKINTTIKESSKQFRRWCIATLRKAWPALWDRDVNEITAEECKEWGAQVYQELSPQYYNNLIGTLTQILEAGLAEYGKRGGVRIDNPGKPIPRTRPRQKQLALPEREQFQALVDSIRGQKHRLSAAIANQIEFLAYSGMRAFSEAAWVTRADVDAQRDEIIVRGNPATGTKNSQTRRVPIIPDMRDLLNRLLIQSSADSYGPRAFQARPRVGKRVPSDFSEESPPSGRGFFTNQTIRWNFMVSSHSLTNPPWALANSQGVSYTHLVVSQHISPRTVLYIWAARPRT